MSPRRAWHIARNDEWNEHVRIMGWDAALIPRRPLWQAIPQTLGILVDEFRAGLADWIAP